MTGDFEACNLRLILGTTSLQFCEFTFLHVVCPAAHLMTVYKGYHVRGNDACHLVSRSLTIQVFVLRVCSGETDLQLRHLLLRGR